MKLSDCMLAAWVGLVAAPVAVAAPAPAADVVINGAKIYTADKARSMAQALAIRNGKLVFVGTDAGAQKWVGPNTRIAKLGGKLVLPGLFDSHIHPIAIVKEDVCNLDSAEKSLEGGKSCYTNDL